MRLQECSLDLMRRWINLFLFLNLFILFLALLGLCCGVGFSLAVVSGVFSSLHCVGFSLLWGFSPYYDSPSFFFNLILAVLGLSSCAGFFLVAVSRGCSLRCGARAPHCSSFSCCRAQALGYVGFRSCGSQALEHRLNNCDP